MDTRLLSSLRRLAVVLLLGAGLGGCAVYGPPYAYDPGYPAYGYPAYGHGYPGYVGPPVTLDLGFNFYKGHRYHHHRGYHGWRSHGGHKHGWSHHRGRGWGSGRH